MASTRNTSTRSGPFIVLEKNLLFLSNSAQFDRTRAEPASPEAASSPTRTQEEKESEDEINEESDFEWEHKDAVSLVVEEVWSADSLTDTLLAFMRY